MFRLAALPTKPDDTMLESHYSELSKIVMEIGRDIKPVYTSNKVAIDRLKKSEACCTLGALNRISLMLFPLYICLHIYSIEYVSEHQWVWVHCCDMLCRFSLLHLHPPQTR